MALEFDLRTFILADGTVSGLVSARMYPVALPQNVTYPAISYGIVSALRDYTMAGPDGLPSVRVQIDAWSENYVEARSLADAIRDRIDGHSGEIGDSPATNVRGIFFDTERSLSETDGVNSAVLHRLSQDFHVWFRE